MLSVTLFFSLLLLLLLMCFQVIENAVAAVKHLQSMGCFDIEFCAEDASRSDPVFLCKVGRVCSVVFGVRVSRV